MPTRPPLIINFHLWYNFASRIFIIDSVCTCVNRENFSVISGYRPTSQLENWCVMVEFPNFNRCCSSKLEWMWLKFCKALDTRYVPPHRQNFRIWIIYYRFGGIRHYTPTSCNAATTPEIRVYDENPHIQLNPCVVYCSNSKRSSVLETTYTFE